MIRNITITLTPAQIRMVNSALAMLEAAGDDEPGYRQDTMDRTREIVWDALERAGVEP